MVVDDIATNILLLKAILGRAKYRIVTATGGREALEKVESESPDLILLDIMMPDMNGYEVIERLKADERFCRIPVIFLSALHYGEREHGGRYILDEYEWSRNHCRAVTIRRWKRDLKKKARAYNRRVMHQAMQGEAD